MEEDEEGNFQDEGELTCRLKGTYIGPHNIDMYVSEGYGHSVTKKELVHIDSLGQPFAYHTLAQVSNISHNEGALNGGQYLTISGMLQKIKRYLFSQQFQYILFFKVLDLMKILGQLK